MNADKPAVAFLGIGLMGRRLAARLLSAGYAVTLWNRTREKALALVPAGASVAETPAEAASGADVVILMLEHGGIVSDVLFAMQDSVMAGIRSGSLVIDMSSIKPTEAQAHAARLSAVGVSYVDAPVSGGTVGAEAGTLAIMCGGDADAFSRADPILRVMGHPSYLGPVGVGQLTKLVNQLIVGVTIAGVAEGFSLAKKGGADLHAVRSALMGGFAHSRVLEVHGERMIEHDFATRGRTTTHLKDLNNACDTAASLDFEGPLLELVTHSFAQLAEHEGDPDHSALILEFERLNNICRD